MWTWIILGLAAAGGVYYYEHHKGPPASDPNPKLDANLPDALRTQLLVGVPLVKDPAVLDSLAQGLAVAPVPGPYPLAAAWVREQAAFLRAHPPVEKTAMFAASSGHPTIVAAHFFNQVSAQNRALLQVTRAIRG